MSIDDIQEEKKKYQLLRSKIISMISKLGDFKTYSSKIKSNVSANYLINNDETPVSNRLYNLLLNTNNIRNYLLKTIIPSIDSEIKQCNTQINKLKASEEAAKAAANKTSTKAKTITKNTPVKNVSNQFNAYSEVSDYDI